MKYDLARKKFASLKVEELEARCLLDAGPRFVLTPADIVHLGDRRQVKTADPLAGQVRSLYKAYLKQKPTDAQLKKALRGLNSGQPLADFEARLLGSKEYFQKRGKNNKARFLRALAKDVLKRALTSTEFATYLAQLKGGSRAAVAAALIRLRDTKPTTPTVPVPPGTTNPPVPPPPPRDFFTLDASVGTTMDAAAGFLYLGSNPRQVGVAPGTIDPVRVAILRGRVLGRDGSPLAGVTLSVLDHPEFGSTRSGADGWFDMAVSGGGPLTVKYTAAGFLAAQRTANVPWQDYTLLDDVVLVPLDSRVTTLDLNAATPVQVAQSNPVTDADGTRQNTLLVSQGTQATMTLPDGSTQPLTTLHVRATEYTVGANGAESMPGQLPANSGYTYAVELSVDEALAAGATSVNFDQPLYNYVENFLDFPVGMAVPAGYYDRVKAQWVASDNGQVVKIVSETAGLADVDGDGDGDADTPAELTALGFTDPERQQLATLYEPGQELWRVPLTHFTPWDYNWPYGPPPGATPPQQSAPPNPQGCGCAICNGAGSVIGYQDQSLGEQVAAAGTPFDLVYTSTRAAGRLDHYTVAVPLSGASVPAGLKAIEVEIEVAGRRIEQSFPAAPDQTFSFTWDGKDVFGRDVTGASQARVEIGYVYEAVYQEPAQFAQSFANFSGVPLVGNRARQDITLPQEFEVTLGHLDGKQTGLGGWDLDVHHTYDPVGQTLYLGDGTRQTNLSPGFNSIIDTIAGTGAAGFSGDGGPATQAGMDPNVIRYGPDGSLYVADQDNHRIRRIDPNGIITTIAGTGTAGFSGDGGPASQAQLNSPASFDFGPDGSLYFFDGGNNRVRRITPDGVIHTVAGTGSAGFSGDGGPATAARIDGVIFLRVSPDGSLYLAEANRHRIRRVGTDGIIRTVIGTGSGGFGGDGGPASQAQISFPTCLAFGPDGSLYFTDGLNSRIRKVDTGGVITTFAGGSPAPAGNGDGGPAEQARFQFFWGFTIHADLDIGPNGTLYISQGLPDVRRIGPDGVISTVVGASGTPDFTGDDGPAIAAQINVFSYLTVAPDGSLVVSDQNNRRIRRVAAPLPGFSADDIALPSRDGTEVYQFNARGRHLRTLDALTSVALYTFAYDAAGRLESVTDRDGNLTRIERDAAGTPTAVVAPFGQRTTLGVDANGYLNRFTDPAGGVAQVTYTADGLLKTFTDPAGKVSTMTYDAMGRLTKDEDSAGGSTTLVMTMAGASHGVTVTTAEGRVTSFMTTESGAGGMTETTTTPDGLQTVRVTTPDGTTTVTTPDGTVVTTRYGPDPRFGMLSPLIVSQTVQTPGGLTYSLSEVRTVTLSDPANPLSVTQLVETTTINGESFTTTFNAAARTITEQTPEGRTSVITLDARGHVIREELPGVTPVEYAFDARGRPIEVKQGTRTATLAYGSDGLLASYTDPLNRTVSYTRDAAGRVIRQQNPDGQEIDFAYDLAGQLTTLTPPGRTAHDFDYNPAGDLETYTPPDLGPGAEASQTIYDLDRKPTRLTRPDGTTIDLAYDFAGRLQTRTTAAGTTTLTYDPIKGLVTGIAAPGGEGLAFGYDGSLLNAVTWSGPVTGSVTGTFDNHFRLTQQMVNGGHAVNFQYDDDGLLEQAGALSLLRDAHNGRLLGTILGGTTDTIYYDVFGGVDSYEAAFNATILFGLNDTRDALGRIVQRVETVAGVARTLDFTYDAAGRLTQVKQDSVIVAEYTYDANDNRLGFTGPGGTVTGTYDAQDRLTQYGGTTYTYSPGGELRTKTDTNGTTTYDYDALGNLRSVALPGGTQIDYVIDGSDRRVGKKVNGTLVQGLLYDGQLRPVAELDGSGAVVSRFVYATGGTVPDFLVKGGVTYRLIADQVGSVRLVVDAATGVAAQQLDYDEFGRVLADTNPGFQPFGFAGGLYDRDTGLVRFGARDYDAETGRWTAKDPIDFAGGQANLYAYVGNDPVSSRDPTGLGHQGEKEGFSWKDVIEKGAEFIHGKQREKADTDLNGNQFKAGLRERRDRIKKHIEELKRQRNRTKSKKKKAALCRDIAANQNAVNALNGEIGDTLDYLNFDNKLMQAARAGSALSPLGGATEFITGSYKTPLDFTH